MTTLPVWLPKRAALTPDRPALITQSRQLTFHELMRAAQGAAAILSRSGVTSSDRVAIMSRNSIDMVIAIHALGLVRAVCVPINIRLKPAEIAFQLQDSRVKFVIHDAGNQAYVDELQRSLTIIPIKLPIDTSTEPSPLDPTITGNGLDQIDLDTIHSIIYTSGTTGKPKGAVLTYGNFWWSAIGSVLNLGFIETDRWLAVLPLFHVGGLSILIRSIIYGIPVILHEAFDAAAINQSIDSDGVTIISAVSVMLSRMIEQRGEVPYPTTLRCVLLGGGPAPVSLLEECARRQIPVSQTYGMTETTSQVATLAPGDSLRKLGSAGKPLFPMELKIVDGEVVVRGPSVSQGYVDRPEETAKVMREGWFYTGDLGYLDDEGYLYILDRRSDLIISGGENVYPAEVEDTLIGHPDVAEAGVIGIPDPTWGRVPVAVVVLHNVVQNVQEELETAALRQFCIERLAKYKVPMQIKIVKSLPRNAAGKLLRREINWDTI